MRFKTTIKHLLIVFLLILVAGGTIFFVFRYELLSSASDTVEDCHDNLLYSHTERIEIEKIFSKENEIDQVATKYSALYRNEKERTMYVFSMPVRNIKGTDDALVNTEISLNGTKSYITKNEQYDVLYKDKYIRIGNDENWFLLDTSSSIETKYNDSFIYLGKKRSSIQYTYETGLTINVFPSYCGIVVNCLMKSMSSISIPVDFPQYRINNSYSGCSVLSEPNSNPKDIMSNNVFVISQPVVSYKDGTVNLNSHVEIKNSNGEYNLFCNISEEEINEPLMLTFSINYYCENMFFDCAAYQKRPLENHIFDNYVEYTANENNQTYNYMKFNIRSFTPKNAELLDQLLLNINVLYCEGETTIEVFSVRHDWCSWTLTWNKKPKKNEKIGEFKVGETGWYTIDLTSYAKRLIGEDYYKLENNSILFKIKTEKEGYVIFASTDNSIYPPFFEVNYRVKN